MSVMQSNETEGVIDLLVQIRGIKTKLLKNLNEAVIIRGPYWNGIMGLKNLKLVSGKNCLIITRGIAQAPSVLVAKKLKFSGNNITVVLDGGSSQTTISKEYFEKIGCSVIEANILNKKIFDENALLMIKDIIENDGIELIFSGGSDIIHKNIIEICKSSPNKILFSCTNNSSICCGEGVCGSCTIRLKDGRKIKACKAQVDPIDIIGGIS
jgi:NAD(P)H-flavin reductase